MSKIFYLCYSLISLPDLSKWNIDNVKYIDDIFNSCNSLIILPNISKWIKNDDVDFYECIT